MLPATQKFLQPFGAVKISLRNNVAARLPESLIVITDAAIALLRAVMTFKGLLLGGLLCQAVFCSATPHDEG